MPTIAAAQTDTQINTYGAGPGTGDGLGSGGGWMEARRNDGQVGSINVVVDKANWNMLYPEFKSVNKYYIYRYFIAFDTSGISVAPSSATFKLYAPGGISTSPNGILVKVNAGANIGLSSDADADDWIELAGYVDNTTMDGNVTVYSAHASPVFTAGTAFNDITLNAAACSDIASLSVFKMALIEYTYDYTNTTYSGNETAGWKRQLYGTFTTSLVEAERPYIDYVAGTASGWGGTSAGKGKKCGAVTAGSVKTFLGVSSANTAKILGIG